MKKIRDILSLISLLLFALNIYGQSPMFIEDFEDGVIPETWTIYDMNDDGRIWESDSRTSVSGIWSAAVSASSDGSKSDWLVTPALIPSEGNNTISFFAKSQVPLPELLEDFKVMVSVTDTLPENFTGLIGEETAIPAEWVKYTYDLSDYEGQQVFVAIINESIDKAVMFVDDITAPYFYHDNDLRIAAIDGPTTPLINVAESYCLTIENKGWYSQSAYQVKLYHQDGTEISSVPGETIEPFQTMVIPLQWSPEEAIVTSIYAEVILESDENTSNNRSKDWHVSVRAADMLTKVHGAFVQKEFSPLFFPARTSLSESIYLADDIGMMGNLTEIAYAAHFQHEVRNKNIRVWLGETNETELNMEWVPASKLTLVYDGQITIPKNNHLIPIRFENPYRYKGGNLVVMMERSWDDKMYGYENQFNVTETERYATIQYEQNFEATDPDKPSVNPWWTKSSLFIPDVHFIFDVDNMGSLSGFVTDDSAVPITDVLVFADEVNLVSRTNIEGQYHIPYIFEGLYHFHATKHGYYNGGGRVTILPNQTHQFDVQLEKIQEVEVTGRITGSDKPDEGIQNAIVSLDGYQYYEAITDEFGNFIFPAVYGSNTYEITVEASGYQKYTEVLEIRQVPVAVNTIMLSEKTPPPIKVTAMDLDMLAAVSWIEPGGMPENVFRYDDGTIDMQIGFEEPLPNSVMGAVFPSNSIVSSISWYLTDEEVHDSVKIIVFGLDMMGKPDVSRIYYQSGMIPNMDNQWNTIELHNYIDAPDGFFVGVSTPNQYISLGIDDGIGEPYEFKYGTYYVNVDWTTGGEWVDAGDLGCDRNMMIRANGYKFGMDKTIASKGTSKLSNISLTTSKANQKQNDYGSCQSETSSRSLENYRVYRLLKGDEAFEDEWDLLSVSFTDTFYEDFSWGFVEPGIYRFAIKAEYSGGLLSAARFSNEIEKKEMVTVNVFVTTNSGDPVTEASFIFNAMQAFPGYGYSTILDESGFFVMNAVPKASYEVDVSLNGFIELHEENIDIQSDTTLSFELEELLKNPYNLMVELSEESALFSWNNKPDAVSEDFEAYEDFTFDFGDWISLNADGMQSMLIQEFDFPHNGEELGFIVFNPEATDPPMMDVTAYSGQKCAAAINAKEAESSDWLISPKTKIVEGTVFRFMARSASDMWELATLRLGVSTTGTNPQDFEIIPGFEYIIAPSWNWNEFIIDLSGYAGEDVYVAIEHFSFESYILLVDDLYIGIPEDANRAIIDYTVYLDDEAVANVTEENYSFDNLINGQTYVAGVTANYTTGSSERQFIEFIAKGPSAIGDERELQVAIYPNPSNGDISFKLESSDEAVVEILDVTGKTVYSKSFRERKIDISLPNPAQGIFIVKVTQANKTISKKILIYQ